MAFHSDGCQENVAAQNDVTGQANWVNSSIISSLPRVTSSRATGFALLGMPNFENRTIIKWDTANFCEITHHVKLDALGAMVGKSGFGFKPGFNNFCQIRWFWIWIGFELFQSGGFGFGFEHCWIWVWRFQIHKSTSSKVIWAKL